MEVKKYATRVSDGILTVFNGEVAKELHLPDDGARLFFMELIEQANGQHCEPGESPVELKEMVYKLAEQIKHLVNQIDQQNKDMLLLTQKKDFSHFLGGGEKLQ